MDSLNHHFLISMPALAGTYFGDSLIYLCEHNPDGAMGLIVNRASNLHLSDLAKELNLMAPTAVQDQPVLEGGPVGGEQGFVLHTDDQSFTSSKEVAAGVVLSSSRDAIAALTSLEPPAHSLVCLGYAGWGPGQLDGEIEEDAWLTVPVQRQILFATPLERKLTEAAASIGIDMRLMARHTGNA